MANRDHLQTKEQVHPAGKAVAVTPDDDVDLPSGICRALYIGGTGDLVVTMADGNDVTFTAVPAGVFPIRVQRVKATLTTATAIVALY